MLSRVSDEQMPACPAQYFCRWFATVPPHDSDDRRGKRAEAAVRAIQRGRSRFLSQDAVQSYGFGFHNSAGPIAQAVSKRSAERLLREYQRQAAVLAKFNADLLGSDTDEGGAVVMNETAGEKEVTRTYWPRIESRNKRGG